MKHEFYAVSNLEGMEVYAYDIELKEIKRGNLKGTKYFIRVNSNIRNTQIPEDFAYNEFLNLDATDIDELTRIQEMYGIIASPTFESNFGNGNATYMLMKSDADLRIRLEAFIKRTKCDKPISAIPLQEVADTVEVLQTLIASTIAVNNDTYTDEDLHHDEMFNILASRTYSKYFQMFGLAENDPNKKVTIINNLIDAVVLQQMKLLAVSDRKIHKCEYRHCGKYFKYPKRERYEPPFYCCRAHQEAEKSCRQNDRIRDAKGTK
ncbi:hypothetical protein [Adlercreutzia sp. ZJ154]|uniref:hypothetical protein n=1 Tax=Adlercreutzia sp. ZJ154 TaxID=2709790 RepID=UPI0013EADD75|nr:hypothetical protein [Adlercreutzia sp. ZJ154]